MALRFQSAVLGGQTSLVQAVNKACSDCADSSSRAEDSPYAQDDKWDAEQLTHIEGQTRLEIDLNYLRKLDEEAERKDEHKAETEVKSCAHFLRTFPVERKNKEKYGEIGYGLVQLTRVAGVSVHLKQEASPGNVGYLAYDL